MMHFAPPSIVEETYSFPLSAQQRGLWLVQQLDLASAAYNMPLILRLQGNLDEAALTKALGEIVRRHEALRTTFSLVEDEPAQDVHPPRPVRPLVVDLSGFRERERNEVALQLRRDACDRPFDLEQGPLLRVRLLRLGERTHELHLVMHHIITDGWSEGVLLRELTTLYACYRHGRPSPLPELPIQYADYALWQREWLRSDAVAKQVAYWRRKLADLPPLEIPRDHVPRSPVRGRGEMLRFVLPVELCRELRNLARREGLTLFVVLLAAFKLLLNRYSGQTDIAVGTVVANRTHRETEDLVGFFVNNLVLRTDFRGPLTFRELLKRVEAIRLEAYEHEGVPFDKLVEQLNPERPAGGMPLVQALFVFQNATAAELRLEGLQLQHLPAEYGYAFVDLAVSLHEEGDALGGHVVYSTEQFGRGTMERLVRHFEHVLASAAAAPGGRLADVSLLTPGERQQILHGWNATKVEHEPVASLQALFEAQAARTPDATAVVFDGRPLTYAGLNAEANRLAHRLRSQGVGPDRLVGICAERSFEMIVAILGALKAGGAYVPLDPEHPGERLAAMIADAGPEVLLTQAHLVERLPSGSVPVWCLDAQRHELADRPASNPVHWNTPSHLAYVIYTSGSTGQPKGVAVPHRGAVNRLQWTVSRFPLAAADRVMQKTPFTFDVSVWEILWPLIAGAALVVSRPGDHRDSRRLIELTRGQGITNLHFVPSMLRAFLEDPDAPTCTSLRRVFCSGEALPADLQQRFFALFDAELHNLYGPTEASIDVSHWACRRGEDEAPVPIGVPIDNTVLYVLDDELHVQPPGLAGELHIGGVALARGYLRMPALTADRFIPDPFGGTPGGRLYKSGDRARFRPDGSIEYLGRLDHQVKIRGHRIELQEIESVLRRLPGVEQAVVVAWDAPGDASLVAYVVPRKGSRFDERALRDGLRRHLPEYMIPAAWVELEALPLSPAGKVSRRGLPPPRFDSHDASSTPPRNVVEDVLAGIWADVLDRRRVGIHDDFFALGGHSLLAAKVIARARTAGIGIPLAAVFDARTVARLAETVSVSRADAGAPRLPAPRRRSHEGPVPLSFSQQQLWIVDQLEPGRHNYNLSVALRLRGDLRVDVLRAALDEVVRRHHVLRTSFPVHERQPRQVVSPDAHASFETVDLTGIPVERREEEAARLVAAGAERPFDLVNGPPFRAGLYGLGERDRVLCLTMHHIVADALSIRILVRELMTLYESVLGARPSPLPELPLQYADVAIAEREWLRGETLARHVDYWRTRLDGCSQVLGLPADFPRPPVWSFRSGTQTIALAGETARGLSRLARRAGATEFMTLAALVNLWLFRYTGQRDILLGTPISNRHHVETEPLIGFFVNTVVLRTGMDPRARFADLLATVRANALRDYAYQALPFEMLVTELGIERDPGRNPLFQVMLNMVAVEEPQGTMAGLDIEDWDAPAPQTPFDITLTARPSSDGPELVCTYSADLFRASTIGRMLESFGELARLVVETPEAPIADLTARLVSFEDARAIERKRRRAEGQRERLLAMHRAAAAGEHRA